MSTTNAHYAEPKTRRVIQLKPDAELARRIDVTAALVSKTAPEFILEKLNAELAHFPVEQPSGVEVANGR